MPLGNFFRERSAVFGFQNRFERSIDNDVDGSVRFVPDTVDVGDLSKPQVTGGPSPYGVWGAFGSMNGEETPFLDYPEFENSAPRL